MMSRYLLWPSLNIGLERYSMPSRVERRRNVRSSMSCCRSCRSTIMTAPSLSITPPSSPMCGGWAVGDGAHDLIIAATARATDRMVLTADERASFGELPDVEVRLITA